jgi:acyl-CoA-binding protein
MTERGRERERERTRHRRRSTRIKWESWSEMKSLGEEDAMTAL